MRSLWKRRMLAVLAPGILCSAHATAAELSSSLVLLEMRTQAVGDTSWTIRGLWLKGRVPTTGGSGLPEVYCTYVRGNESPKRDDDEASPSGNPKLRPADEGRLPGNISKWLNAVLGSEVPPDLAAGLAKALLGQKSNDAWRARMRDLGFTVKDQTHDTIVLPAVSDESSTYWVVRTYLSAVGRTEAALTAAGDLSDKRPNARPQEAPALANVEKALKDLLEDRKREEGNVQWVPILLALGLGLVLGGALMLLGVRLKPRLLQPAAQEEKPLYRLIQELRPSGGNELTIETELDRLIEQLQRAGGSFSRRPEDQRRELLDSLTRLQIKTFFRPGSRERIAKSLKEMRSYLPPSEPAPDDEKVCDRVVQSLEDSKKTQQKLAELLHEDRNTSLLKLCGKLQEQVDAAIGEYQGRKGNEGGRTDANAEPGHATLKEIKKALLDARSAEEEWLRLLLSEESMPPEIDYRQSGEERRAGIQKLLLAALDEVKDARPYLKAVRQLTSDHVEIRRLGSDLVKHHQWECSRFESESKGVPTTATIQTGIEELEGKASRLREVESASKASETLSRVLTAYLGFSATPAFGAGEAQLTKGPADLARQLVDQINKERQIAAFQFVRFGLLGARVKWDDALRALVAAGKSDLVRALRLAPFKDMNDGSLLRLLASLEELGDLDGLRRTGLQQLFGSNCVHNLMRAELLLDTYFQGEDVCERLSGVLAQLNASLRLALWECGTRFGVVEILGPAPEGARTQSPDAEFTRVPEIRSHVLRRFNEGARQFVVDVRAFPVMEGDARFDGTVVTMNPVDWGV